MSFRFHQAFSFVLYRTSFNNNRQSHSERSVEPLNVEHLFGILSGRTDVALYLSREISTETENQPGLFFPDAGKNPDEDISHEPIGNSPDETSSVDENKLVYD